ncbi:MAG TPA: hypothetical protein VGK20_08865 [Candidatus Binatia bacterium]|jgi:signal transduction histidine kinase
MSRIAVVAASPGTVVAVRAAADGHEVVEACEADIGSDAALVVTEDPQVAGRIVASTPCLLLADRAAVRKVRLKDRKCTIVEKPCDLIVLRSKIRLLLELSGQSAAATLAADDLASWLAPPRIAKPAAVALASAGRFRGAVFIVGERGTGTDDVAAALGRVWDEREPLIWQEPDLLESITARLADDERVLWVPAIDERPARDQIAFERWLASARRRRVIVTASDDPASTVACGRLSATLFDRLSRLAVRLAPLRERSADVGALASSIGSRVAADAFGASLRISDASSRMLADYGWPGNVIELEAVITRSVLALEGAAVLDAGDLRFLAELAAPASPVPLSGETEAPSIPDVAASPPRIKGIVVPLGQPPSRVARPGDGGISPTAETAPTVATTAEVESVLAGFAHDLRNPLSTIRTFTELSAGDERISGALGPLAVEACRRVDDQLNLLQRYSDLAPDMAATAADLVELFTEAAEATVEESQIRIDARAPVHGVGNPSLLRFVAAAIVDECCCRAAEARRLGRAGDEAVIDTSPDRSAVTIRIAAGAAAASHLDTWTSGAALPWRLALAREVARRAGGDLSIQIEDAELCLKWRAGSAFRTDKQETEEPNDGDQAGSTDRRRRTRSS